jgi:hypothetical protein
MTLTCEDWVRDCEQTGRYGGRPPRSVASDNDGLDGCGSPRPVPFRSTSKCWAVDGAPDRTD